MVSEVSSLPTLGIACHTNCRAGWLDSIIWNWLQPAHKNDPANNKQKSNSFIKLLCNSWYLWDFSGAATRENRGCNCICNIVFMYLYFQMGKTNSKQTMKLCICIFKYFLCHLATCCHLGGKINVLASRQWTDSLLDGEPIAEEILCRLKNQYRQLFENTANTANTPIPTTWWFIGGDNHPFSPGQCQRVGSKQTTNRRRSRRLIGNWTLGWFNWGLEWVQIDC